jgi:hypothetical protein
MEHLITLLSKLPWNEIAFIICSLIGGMMHYTKKFLRNETDVSMFRWFGSANWVTTMYTLIMFVFVTIGALAGGIINSQTDFWAVLYTGFMTGFAVDAGFNTDKGVTEQLIDIKAESKELFKDNADAAALKKAKADDDTPAVLPTKLAIVKPAKVAVAGSPRVPPKRIT